MLQINTVKAATENDLREVMGYERLDRGLGEAEAKKLIAACNEKQRYNDVLQEVEERKKAAKKEKRLAENERVDSLKESYMNLMNQVASGEDMEQVREAFLCYESFCESTTNETERKEVKLEPIGEKEIEEQRKRAEKILLVADTTADIGKVGLEMPAFLGEILHVSEISSGYIKVYSGIDESVRAQLTGKVTAVKKNSITIKSGATIYLTYTGVKPKVSEKANVKQGQEIGTANGYEVKLSMRMLNEKVNPLQMYGTRANYWYEDYVNANPWVEADDDMSLVKDKPELSEEDSSEKESEDAAGIVTDEKGELHNIYIEGEQSTGDSVYEENPLEGEW